MGRKVDWSTIPDIEYLDAEGERTMIATIYNDGRITVDDMRTAPPDEE